MQHCCCFEYLKAIRPFIHLHFRHSASGYSVYFCSLNEIYSKQIKNIINCCASLSNTQQQCFIPEIIRFVLVNDSITHFISYSESFVATYWCNYVTCSNTVKRSDTNGEKSQCCYTPLGMLLSQSNQKTGSKGYIVKFSRTHA